MYWNPQWEQQGLQQAHGWNPFYNAMSPTADIGGGISSVLGMLSQKKEMERQKQLEDEKFQWERDFQATRKRGMGQEQQIRDLTIRDYVSPDVTRQRELTDATTGHTRDLERITKAEDERRKTATTVANVRATKTGQELDKDYLSDVAEINKAINAQANTAHLKRIEAIQEILSNSYMFKPNEVQDNIGAINTEYENYVKSLEDARKSQVEALAEIYPELPRAKVIKPGAGTQAPPAGGGMAVAGSKKRSELPAGADVRVNPETGQKLVKIDGKIYMVID